MFLIVLIGIIGNASIIIIILRNKVLRLQPTNLFLLNMALSDFMNLCINPALHLFKSDVLFTNYYLGKVCCFLSPFLTGKSKLSSNLNSKQLRFHVVRPNKGPLFSVSIFLSGALSLSAITLNRVIGIVMPKLADILELNPLIVYAILISIWLISFGIAAPNFSYRQYKVRQHKNIDNILTR